jgi:hypothetical protein
MEASVVHLVVRVASRGWYKAGGSLRGADSKMRREPPALGPLGESDDSRIQGELCEAGGNELGRLSNR